MRRNPFTPKSRRKLTDSQRTIARAKRSVLEEEFLKQCREAGISPHKKEYLFDPHRKWRLDFVWFAIVTSEEGCQYPSNHGTAVEIHGGVDVKGYGVRGRHVTGKGFSEDRRKMNWAMIRGWDVLEFTRDMLERRPDGRMRTPEEESEAIYMLRRVLGCQSGLP